MSASPDGKYIWFCLFLYDKKLLFLFQLFHLYTFHISNILLTWNFRDKQWFATLSQVLEFYSKVWRVKHIYSRKNYRKNHWEDSSNLCRSCEISQAVLNFAQSFMNLKKRVIKKKKKPQDWKGHVSSEEKKIYTLLPHDVVSKYDRTSSTPQCYHNNMKVSFGLCHMSSP